MKVVTRFAPSPTGMLHIGGARTALFNFLFARHHGGEFLLRVEDTDKKRSTDAATQAILDGLRWLGVHWNDEPYFQSAHEARHREVAEELRERGEAYYCYTTAEELAEQRKAAEARGEVFRYNREWRPSATAGATLAPPANVKPSIRIKAPLEGEVVVHDAVQGDVRFPAAELDDLVILRSDGTPTYNLAVVVDDHDMGVTHVIRGDDHLNNAGRQSVIYKAMGWEVPVFAHIPLIHGPDGAKLSKRHGATSVMEYRDMGYLPEALRNYLVRLGWSHGDDEIFSDEQAIAWFGDLGDINKAPARLDFAKLNHVNAHYLRLTDDAVLIDHIAPDATAVQRTLLLRAMPSLKTRASTLVELAGAAQLYLHRPAPDEKAQAALATGQDRLRATVAALEALAGWSATPLREALAATAASAGCKLGEVIQPVRAAITGSISGQNIEEVMEALEREESLARLRAALAA